MKYKKYRDGGFNSLPQIFADGGISRFEVPVQQAKGLSPFELPYNQIATALLSKQKAQDEAQLQGQSLLSYADKIKSLDPSITPEDRAAHKQILDDINQTVGGLYNTDLTTPQGKKGLYEAKRKIAGYFGPEGVATKLGERYDRWNSIVKNINDDKNLDIKPNLRNAFIQQAKNTIPSLQDEKYNNINSPSYYKPYSDEDINKAVSEAVKNTGNEILSGPELSQFKLNPYEYLAQIKTTDGKTYAKLMQGIDSYLGPDIRKSVEQDAQYLYGMSPQDAARQSQIFDTENGKIKLDKNNNPIPANTILGQRVYGAASSAQSRQLHTDYRSYQDHDAIAKAKYNAEHPVVNFTGTTAAINFEPLSGKSATDYKAYQQNISNKKDEILKTLAQASGKSSYAGIDDFNNIDWSNTSLTPQEVQLYKDQYNRLEQVEGIAKVRDAQIENEAIKAAGLDPVVFKQTKDKLPIIPGVDKDQALEVINDFYGHNITYRDGKYYRHGSPITKEEYEKLNNIDKAVRFTEPGKQYLDFVKNQNKVITKKSELYNTQTNNDLVFSSRVLNLPENQSNELYRQMNESMKDLSNFSHWTIESGTNPEFKGQTIAQLVSQGKIKEIKNEDTKSDIAFTKNFLTNDLSTDHAALGIRKTLIIDGKPVEFLFKTDNFTAPAIDAEINNPQNKALKEYDYIRKELQGKGTSPSFDKDFTKYNVAYDLDNKRIIVAGKSFNENTGQTVLKAIKTLDGQTNPNTHKPYTISEIIKYSEDVK